MGSCKVVGVVNTKVANCRGRTEAKETQKGKYTCSLITYKTIESRLNEN